MCNGCVEEQHVQVYLKLTMNTKPDTFQVQGVLDASRVLCKCPPSSSPHQGSSGLWGDIPTPGISHSHLSNPQMESGFSENKYCPEFTSCHCMPEPKAAAADTFPPILHKYGCLWVHSSARELSVCSGR